MKSIYFVLITLLLASCSKNNLNDNPSDLYLDDGIRPSSIIHDGGLRDYQLYIPPGYNETDPLPVVINFHSFDGDAYEYLINTSDMRSIASVESNPFFLVYPQAGYCDGGLAWNPCELGGDNKCYFNDIDFIEALLDSLSIEFEIDSSRIYACGYSNGGMMAMGLGMKSDRFAAVGSVSGAMLDRETPSRPMPTIIIHGTLDESLPYAGNSFYNSVQSQIDFWVNVNNTDSIPLVSSETSPYGITTDHYRYLNGDNDVSVEHYKIIDGGHVWRMDQQIYPAGKPDDDTGLILWEFFNRYSL